MNELVKSYNAMVGATDGWESKAETGVGRTALAEAVRTGSANLVSAAMRLEEIRKEYPQLQDLVAVLSNSPAEQVKEAASAFADAVTQNGSETDDNRVVRLRKLEGALQLQMGAMDNWMSDLGRKANLRVRDLSGVK